MVRSGHRSLRALVLSFGALLAAASVASCGNDSAEADVPAIDIVLGRYTISPAEVTVPAGALELNVTNSDSIVHDLVVAGRGTRQLAPGESQTISIETEPGEYRMWCDIAGHADMGQTGVLRSETVAVTAPTVQP